MLPAFFPAQSKKSFLLLLIITFQTSPRHHFESWDAFSKNLFLNPIPCQQEMGSKQKMGYKCRIAGVFFLLLASIAALVSIAVIQDTWRFKQYSEEVRSTDEQVFLQGGLCFACRSLAL